jgi:putative transposase
MPRTARAVRAGVVYHMINRGNAGADLFHKPADFDAFLRVLAEALERQAKARRPVDLLAYCLMSNHWHLVLRSRRAAGDSDSNASAGSATGLSRMMGWLGVTHVRRHHQHYHTRGGGHLYQGRFKSFPVQSDRHLLLVCRYAEANPLRAGMVGRAEDWPYSSVRWSAGLARGEGAGDGERAGDGEPPPVPLAPWPVDRPKDWLACVNEPLPAAQLDRLRASARRGRPFGDDAWTRRIAARLGLGHTLRGPGRPRKKGKAKARGNQ